MPYLPPREINALADKIAMRNWQLSPGLPPGNVSRAASEVLAEEFGASRTRVDPQHELFDPSTQKVTEFDIRKVQGSNRVGEKELRNVRDPGSLWLLQRRIADLKFELLKTLIAEGQQLSGPIKADVIVELRGHTVSLNADLNGASIDPRLDYVRRYDLSR